MSDHVQESSQILLVSREASAIGLLSDVVGANGWRLETATSGWEALERVQAGTAPDAIILEVAQGENDGLHILRWLRRVRPDLPIVLLSHATNSGQKMDAMRLGAREFLILPWDKGGVEAAIRRCLNAEGGAARMDDDGIEQVAEDSFFVAAGANTRKLRAQVELLAQVSTPLLIVGEAGSGKEAVARLIHKRSVRSAFRFFKINCAALPGDVLEGELFGYQHSSGGNGCGKPSKFELCQKGTLFLDGIVGLPMNLQLRLLQVLQDGCFIKADGQTRVCVDVRVIASSNISLEQAIADGKLREDLGYRLSAFTVHVPSLRQRKEEIPLLLGHFMNQLARRYDLRVRILSSAMLEACQAYDWPGNLRELESFIKRYLVVGEENLLPGMPDESTTASALEEFPAPEDGYETNSSGLKSLLQSVKGEAEKNAIITALEQTHWNRKAAARLLQVSYRTLLYKIEQYHMSPPRERACFVANSNHP